MIEIKPRRRHRFINSRRGLSLIFSVLRALRGLIKREARLIKILDLQEARFDRFIALRIECHRRIGHVIEQIKKIRIKKPEPMLDAGKFAACRHRFIKRIAVGYRAEQFAVAGAELRNRTFIQQHFRNRAEMKALDFFGRGLRQRIEHADRFDLVAEEIQPQRHLVTRRIEIDDAAAHGELARLAHGARAYITVGGKEPAQFFDRQFVADGGIKASRHQHVRRQGFLHNRVDCGEDDRRLPERLAQTAQRRDTFTDDIGVRGDAVVRQAIPGRKRYHFALWREKIQRVAQHRRAHIVERDMNKRPALRTQGDFRQHARIVPGGRAGDCYTARPQWIEGGNEH